jgi:hypothetical protein
MQPEISKAALRSKALLPNLLLASYSSCQHSLPFQPPFVLWRERQQDQTGNPWGMRLDAGFSARINFVALKLQVTCS